MCHDTWGVLHYASPMGPTACGIELDDLPGDHNLATRPVAVTCPACLAAQG